MAPSQKLEGSPDISGIHAMLQQIYHWAKMATDFVSIICDYTHCVKNQICPRKRLKSLNILPAFEQLKAVTIHIPESLLKKKDCFKNVIAIGNRLTKPIQVVPLTHISPVNLA